MSKEAAKEAAKVPSYKKQPTFGVIGWVIEWIGMAALYFILKGIGWDWFQVTAVVLFACFASFWIGSMGNWPFHKLKQPLQGILACAVSFIIGVVQWYYMAWANYPPATYAFPVILNTFFLYLVTNFLFENIHMKNLKNPLAGFLNAALWYFGAYILVSVPTFLSSFNIALKMAPFSVPAWWFPVAGWYFLCMGVFWTRNMTQPAKGVYGMLVLVIGVFIMSAILMAVGVQYGSLPYLAWVALWSEIAPGLFIFLENYPWRKLKQPAMGLVGVLIFGVIGAIEMLAFYFAGWAWTEVIAFGFSGVCWGYMMAFQFGYGFPSTFNYLGGGSKE